jgi:putative NADH-flavin reductase
VPYIEITRKIVIAVKQLKNIYLIMIGGTGSLSIPGKPLDTAVDSVDFWIAYFQHAADSDAYRSYASIRFPKFATLLERYKDIRQTQDLDEEDQEFLQEMAQFSKSRVTQSHFIMACRASLLFFEGNMEFNWTFLSPPPGFKPGPKTGKYALGKDAVLPVDGDQEPPWEGRLMGITVKDLAAVIADEAETRKMEGRHWTVWTPTEFAVDVAVKDVYGTLSEVERK